MAALPEAAVGHLRSRTSIVMTRRKSRAIIGLSDDRILRTTTIRIDAPPRAHHRRCGDWRRPDWPRSGACACAFWAAYRAGRAPTRPRRQPHDGPDEAVGQGARSARRVAVLPSASGAAAGD